MTAKDPNWLVDRTLLATALDAPGFLRLPQVLALYPISKASWWNGIKAGRYPAGVKIGPHTTAWRTSDIKALIEAAE